MDKVWCIFYVSDYKGGELRMTLNVDIQKMLDRLTDEWYFLYGAENNDFSDDELWEMWKEWYNDEEQHNLYAYDSRSEKQVFSIKNGKLVKDFPTKKEILKYAKLTIKEWKQDK